jgi:hypothetical protein
MNKVCDPRIICTFNVCFVQLFEKNCTLRGYYMSSGNFLPMFWGIPIGPIFKGQESFGFSTSEDGTSRLARNIGKKLPLLAV